ncbi:preprotein translocase subunit YajC [Mesoaciditoga sp.]
MFENFVAFADASAQKAAPASGGGSFFSGTTSMLVWLIVLGVLFYFMLVYPQKKRSKTFNNMMSNLKRGDTVITVGGIVGKVTDIKDKTIKIKTAGNDLEITKRSVASIMKSSSNSGNGKEDKSKDNEEKSKSDLIK